MRRHAKSLVRLIDGQVGTPHTGAEVGVWRGHTSLALLESFPTLTLYCVDPWDTPGIDQTTMGKDGEPKRMKAAMDEFFLLTMPYMARRVVLMMDSVSAAEDPGCNNLDFVFIDGDHRYESVARDVRAWAPRIRPGGVLSGHDYDGMGDRRGKFGVKRAVDEWADEERRKVKLLLGSVWWTKI